MAVAVTVHPRAPATGLNQPREHEPRYGLRLGLGTLALAVGAVMILRASARPPRRRQGRARTAARTRGEGAPRKPGLVARMTANPRPRTAFIAGLLLFAPGATFIAAVQVVATADVTRARDRAGAGRVSCCRC